MHSLYLNRPVRRQSPCIRVMRCPARSSINSFYGLQNNESIKLQNTDSIKLHNTDSIKLQSNESIRRLCKGSLRTTTASVSSSADTTGSPSFEKRGETSSHAIHTMINTRMRRRRYMSKSRHMNYSVIQPGLVQRRCSCGCGKYVRVILDEYFEERRRIEKKYIDMLFLLSAEENSAIVFAVKKYSNTGRSMCEIVDSIKHDYEVTRQLLKTQRLVEEEENVGKYSLNKCYY